MRPARLLAVAAVLAAAAGAAVLFPLAPPVLAGDGFTTLFDGTNVDDFQFVGVDESTYSLLEGPVVVCTGKPNGYSLTRKSYRNYHLKFDYRYPRPADLTSDAEFKGNSGLLIHVTGELKVWPRCVEVQLMHADAGNIFGLSGGKATAKKDAEAQKKAIKPVGEWSTMEVISRDGTLTAILNGQKVAEATGADPAQGQIGWQSEGAEIHFRNLKLKEL